MADAARFPGLTLPFAITGAAAGWLSQGLLQHPLVVPAPLTPRVVAAGTAAILGGAAGFLVTRWCAGRRYGYEIEAPDPTTRPPTDRWPRHAAVLLAAGAATGALVGEVSFFAEPGLGALLGLACTLPFLPVFAAVLRSARRAQRARLGSLVAASDRRAVWGILATLLAASTVGAVLDWHAPFAGDLGGPLPAVAFLALSTLCILSVLLLDVLALRRVKGALPPVLAPSDSTSPTVEDGTPRLDLGLGAGVHHQVARTGPVYRSRDRAVAVVEGDPREALAALRRAIRRGAAGIVVALGAMGAHAAGQGATVAALYDQQRCAIGDLGSCGRAASYVRAASFLSPVDPRDRVAFFQKACDGQEAMSCLTLARMYRGSDGIDHDHAMVAYFEYRAAQLGLCPPRTRLLRGAENVCVDDSDPRLDR